MPQSERSQPKGFLFDVRVLELADERGEFCGKLLAGAGAEVVKVEPPGGSRTRAIGPFYEDIDDPERSLHFWHYNFGKRGITLDITKPEGQRVLKELAPRFDVVLETYAPGYLAGLGLGYDDLKALNPGVIMASITPFGQTGPWRDWKATDLVQLALGGVMMNCGYDPMPDGEYDTPPIAPQMWHASHIVGNYTYMSIVAALLFREQSGIGQHLDASIHHAVNTCTEMDIPYFTYNRKAILRQTGRHAGPAIGTNPQALTKDGRLVWCSGGLGGTPAPVIEMLDKHGMADDLTDPKYKEEEHYRSPAGVRHISAVTKRWVQSRKWDAELWKEGQRYGQHWAPIRKPEENADDPHWLERKTFTQVHHEEIGRTLTYNGAPWLSETTPWRTGPRAPHLGEHTDQVLGQELGIPQARLDELRRQNVI